MEEDRMRDKLLQPTIPKCKEGYSGLIPIFCKQCGSSRYNTDDVVLTVLSQDAQELFEVLCSIPQEVEMGEYSDGIPHRPPGVDCLIDQLVKYSLEGEDNIEEMTGEELRQKVFGLCLIEEKRKKEMKGDIDEPSTDYKDV